MMDRTRIEERWVDQFGKPGWARRGERGRILVGTQVLEQSPAAIRVFDVDGRMADRELAEGELLIIEGADDVRPGAQAGAFLDARAVRQLAPGFESVGRSCIFAPFAVLAAITANVAENGIGIMAQFAIFMVDFYLGLFLLWCALIFAGYLFLGKRIKQLMLNVREAFLISFATASSEAAYPKILDGLDRFGVNRKVSSFVMPLGYSFNLDGSMMYCTFATLFIAQAYDIHLDLGTQITMLLILMLTSKGMAGVPRASLVVIAATLNQFNIPEAGLLLILGIDTFLDMGRSATNAVGNSIAAAVIAKSEGELLSVHDAKIRAAEIDREASAHMHGVKD
jgi:Na+/H+-dicarboxylate symporter